MINSYRSGLLSNSSCDVGAEELVIEDKRILIYPNPATDNITISNIEAGTTIVLTDLLGNVLIETKAQSDSTPMDLSHLPNGIYFVNGEKVVKTLGQ